MFWWRVHRRSIRPYHEKVSCLCGSNCRCVYMHVLYFLHMFFSSTCLPTQIFSIRNQPRRQKKWWSAYLLFYDRISPEGDPLILRGDSSVLYQQSRTVPITTGQMYVHAFQSVFYLQTQLLRASVLYLGPFLRWYRGRTWSSYTPGPTSATPTSSS